MADLWYALRIKTGCEKFVDLQLQSKGYETFLPTYISRNQWSDRIKSVRVPLFAGYTFCRFDIHARLPVLITPGVQFVVGAGHVPVAVDEPEIEAVRRVINSGLPAQPWPYLKIGDIVEVNRGPLEGLRGPVVRVKNIDRLVVSVSLLMRSIAVEIGRESIQPSTGDAFVLAASA